MNSTKSYEFDKKAMNYLFHVVLRDRSQQRSVIQLAIVSDDAFEPVKTVSFEQLEFWNLNIF